MGGMPRSSRTRECSHSARPSAVCTPRPWTNSCSANSPSVSRRAISSVTSDQDDDVVALGVAREVPQQRPRAQVVLLGPHALQARAEVLAQQPPPLLALDA